MIVAYGLSSKVVGIAFRAQWYVKNGRHYAELELLAFAKSRHRLNKTEHCWVGANVRESPTWERGRK